MGESGLHSDSSHTVRLFPLPDLVLFPCTAQPLHIFESRYCEMLEEALATDRLIALATLTPGYDSNEYYGRPPLETPVCVGRVTACESNANGTYDLLVVGVRRALIEDELPPERSFRRAQVQMIEAPDSERSPSDKSLAEALVHRIKRLVPSSKAALDALLDRNSGLGELTDVLAFHTNLSTAMKLKLLSEGNPARRAEMILASLPARESFDGGDLPPFSLN